MPILGTKQFSYPASHSEKVRDPECILSPKQSHAAGFRWIALLKYNYIRTFKNLFASSQLYVQNHIHNYFPALPVCLNILPICELIKHKQASSSFVALFPLSHFVNLKWSTRQYLKIFRDVITGKELPQSCFNCFFPFKAILSFIFYQLFMRISYLFLSRCKSQNF